MKKRSIFFSIAALLLAFVLGWSLSSYSHFVRGDFNLDYLDKYKETYPFGVVRSGSLENKYPSLGQLPPESTPTADTETQLDLWTKQWKNSPPRFQGEDVVAMYIYEPSSFYCWQLANIEDANGILKTLDNLPYNDYRSNDSDVGLVILTPQQRQYIFLADDAKSQQGIAARELINDATSRSAMVVDIYQLLTSDDIESVQLWGSFRDDSGQVKTLSLDTSDKTTIEDTLNALRKTKVAGMEFTDKGSSFSPKSGYSYNYYSIRFNLGEVYDSDMIVVQGDPERFLMSVDFHPYNRVFTTTQNQTNNALKEIAKLAESQIAEDDSPSIKDFMQGEK